MIRTALDALNAPSSRDVVAMYERYPYPPPGWDLPSSWRAILGPYLPARPRRILDAGCGTGAVAATLAQGYPDAEVVGIDLSEPSLERARARPARKNLRFERADLTADLQHLGRFDVICSLGVLHHLPMPEVGLKRLVELCSTDATFVLFLYAYYGRLRTETLRKAVRLVAADDDLDQQMRVARSLLGFTSPSSAQRLIRWVKRRTGVRLDSLQIDDADRYVNPIVHTYTVRSVLELMKSSGLRLDRFISGYPGNLIDDLNLLPAAVAERARGLDREQRWELLELLEWPQNLTFVATPSLRA